VGKHIGVLVLALLGAAAAFSLYAWYRNYSRQARAGDQALSEIRQFISESSSLATLGDINIDPADVTLQKLDKPLQRPSHEILRNSKSAAMGWACGGNLCAVRAFFVAPSSGQVSPTAVPVTLWISQDNLGKTFVGSIGGII